MQFLLDANLPRLAEAAVAGTGHAATSVHDVRLGSAPDPLIAAYARTNRMVLVTRDFDFADIRNYPPADYSGVVVLDLPDAATAREVASFLSAYLQSADVATLLPGRLAIVRPGRVRYRPPP